MLETMITQITAHYLVAGDELHATLVLEGQTDAKTILTILHDGIGGGDQVAISGDATSREFTLSDADILVIVAQRGGCIIGSSVYEVNTTSASLGFILEPKSSAGLLLTQCEAEAMATLPKPLRLVQAASQESSPHAALALSQ